MKLLGSKTLETNRLILHKTEEKDLKLLWEILSIEEVSRYYLTTKINNNWADECKWQYKKLQRASNEDVFCWTIELKETHEVIGQISVQDGPNKIIKEERDIGWFLDPMYQKKGYAYEAALEVLKYMFLEVGITKIITSSAKNNKSSYLLMERLGFKRQDTTHYVKYTLLDKEQEVYEYILTKKDFLKEIFRKDKLYITIDIDKEPYVKYITDDRVLNVTGESGSGKTTFLNDFKNNNNFIIIDTDLLNKENNNKYIKELTAYLMNKYKKIPSTINEFDILYKEILDYYKDYDKIIVIDSAQFRNLHDLSLLKGEIIILRTCINNCYERCLERYKKTNPNTSYEDFSSYSSHKKEMYKWYHSLNNFIDKVDKI